jgi:hypothetical protein
MFSSTVYSTIVLHLPPQPCCSYPQSPLRIKGNGENGMSPTIVVLPLFEASDMRLKDCVHDLLSRGSPHFNRATKDLDHTSTPTYSRE